MVIYTCPKCGADCVQEVLTCMPPIHVTKCTKCGWRDGKREEVIRVPYETKVVKTVDNKITETFL